MAYGLRVLIFFWLFNSFFLICTFGHSIPFLLLSIVYQENCISNYIFSNTAVSPK